VDIEQVQARIEELATQEEPSDGGTAEPEERGGTEPPPT
jgi:hypothetical protein